MSSRDLRICITCLLTVTKIVLPNATVATVNEHTNADLYFALRGGMNNFGIITHFTMRAVPQTQFYSGQKSYSADKRDTIADIAYELTTGSSKSDTAMSFYYGFGYDQETDNYTLTFTQEYSQPIFNPRPFYRLNRVPSESSTIRIDWSTSFSREVDSATPPGGRYVPSPFSISQGDVANCVETYLLPFHTTRPLI